MNKLVQTTPDLLSQELHDLADTGGDVTMISSSDQSRVSVHSLVLAASSSMLRSALQDIAAKDLDDLVILIPDTSQEELKHFVNLLYRNIYHETLQSSTLMQLIENSFDSATNTEDDDHDDTMDAQNNEPDNNDNFTATELERMIRDDSQRISFKESGEAGRQTKVWRQYKQILVDHEEVSYVQCKSCGDVMEHTLNSSSTDLLKHVKNHGAKQDKDEADTEKISRMKLSDIKMLVRQQPDRIGELVINFYLPSSSYLSMSDPISTIH